MPTYALSGVDVEFPYDAYPCQLDYMTSVIQALQQLAEQAVAVAQDPHRSQIVQGLREAWAQHKAEQAEAGVGLPAVIYSSRTHSQLAQVMRELRRTGYRVRSAVLSSRAHTCLHPAVSKMGGQAANRACRALVGRRGCKWQHAVERCAKGNPELGERAMDIEELVRFGAERQVCPFLLSKELATTADVLFVPYNYLIDPQRRKSLNVAWKDAVLIFDEAHNVESVCSEVSSFDLPATTLAGAIEELGTAAELALQRGDGDAGGAPFDERGRQGGGAVNHLQLSTELRQAQIILAKLEQSIAALPVPGDKGLTRPGEFLFELLAKINLTWETWPVLQACLESGVDLLAGDALESGRRSGTRSAAYRLHALQDALSLAFEAAAPPTPGSSGVPAARGFRVHVHRQAAKSGVLVPTLSFWCFAPGHAMLQLKELQVRSILLTSGTLSPLSSFAAELGVGFPHRLENPHVISPSQIWVGVVPVGPSGHALNASFQTRNSPEYREDLGNAVVNYARLVPDGLLVFFPSYSLLESCVEGWKMPAPGGAATVWDRICRHKHPVVEPRDAAQFGLAVQDYQAKLDAPGGAGAVLFAVCRGKASEGIDFSDRAGRAVIITGIPYANKGDAKVRLKQEVLNENLQASHKRQGAGDPGPGPPGLSGDQWYVQQAARAVNQAIGRVIRHKDDYGAVILCDERFRAPNVKNQLSKWLREHVTVYPDYGKSVTSLSAFYRAHRGVRDSASGRSSGGTAVAEPPSAGGGCVLQDACARSGPGTNAGPAPRAASQDPAALLRTLPAAMGMAGITSTLFVANARPPEARAGTSVLEELDIKSREPASLSQGPAARPWQKSGASLKPTAAKVEAPQAVADNEAPTPKVDVKEFMLKLKAELLPDAFRAVNGALQRYGKDRELGPLVSTVLGSMGAARHRDLLSQFSAFLPPQSRPEFLSKVRELPVQDSVEEAKAPAVSTADRVWRALDGVEHLPRVPAAPQATPAAGGQRLVLPGAGSVPRASAPRCPPATAAPAPGQARTLSSRSGPQGVPLPAPGPVRVPSARSGLQTAPQPAPRPASGHLAPHNRPRASPLVAGPKAQASKPAAQPASARSSGAAPQAAKSAPAGRDGPAAAPQRAGPPCAMCGVAPMRQPHQGACGHTACKSCWMAAVTRFKCPVCGKPARASQLLPRAG